jgi:glycosyltransferase involved in cell wall biosynthesis
MKYRVAFYCPDRHILYDAGRQPDKHGVGGGVVARIRLAQALASLGHEVELMCNCVRTELHLGVNYVPLNQVRKIEADVLVLTTSGDKLDISPILELDLSVKLTLLVVHGVPKVNGIQEVQPDKFYLISNFIKDVVETEWGIDLKQKSFVTYHGVNKSYYQRDYWSGLLKSRNNFQLAYVGNPIKGRGTTLQVFRLLRKLDSRYRLAIFGDEKLWGGEISRNKIEAGVRNYGSVPQRKLAQLLLTCGFSVFLQTIREGFGLSLIETMTAGCIPIASAVGAFPELIQHGKNGFLINGDPMDASTQQHAAALIHELQQDRTQLEEIRKNAINSTLEWREVALAWEQHWDIVLGNSDINQYQTTQACPTCSNKMYGLADGLHCLHCGHFTIKLI